MTASCKPRTIVLDLETYSSADLTKTGVFKYVEAPDFEILLMSYAKGDEPVQIWDFTEFGVPPDLRELLVDPEVIKVAHNCQFERACLNKALGIYSPPEQWIDTMHLAAMNGLPMTLEAAGAALQLEQQKLDTGKALIRYFCKPCAPICAARTMASFVGRRKESTITPISNLRIFIHSLKFWYCFCFSFIVY